MGTIATALGGLARPLALALVLLIGLGLVSQNPSAGRTGADGFACRGFTSDPDVNRVICRFHPARIWNMPVSEVLPFLPAAEKSPG